MNRFFVCLISILFLTLLVYIPAINNDFVNWDDDVHLTENHHIRSLSFESIKDMFQRSVNQVYIPLTFLSFAIEYHFFQYNPTVYHFTNILLHLVIVGLIFYFAFKLGMQMSAAAMAAIIFAVHPLHVESVAWVTERKDVLYSLFYMLALISYWRYLSQKKKSAYIFSIIFGFLSMLSKPMALSLPLVLFVCDFWMERKIDKRAFFDKLPHLIYVVPIAWLTFSQWEEIDIPNWFQAPLIWIWSFTFYIQKFFLPIDLSPIYLLPRPVSLFNGQYFISMIIFLGIVFSLYYYRRYRWWVGAVIFYIFSIFFMLRMMDVAETGNHSIVADRFMYLPSLGFCLFVGWLWNHLQKERSKIYSEVIRWSGVLLVCIFLVNTFFQCNVWQDSIALWNHAIKLYPQSVVAYNNRGNAYAALENQDLALKDFNQALAIYSDFPGALNNRGVIYYLRKDYDAAFRDYNRALSIDPKLGNIYDNRGVIYFLKGQHDLAFADFNKSIELSPDYASAYNNRGFIYLFNKKQDLARIDFDKAITLNPKNPNAYFNRALLRHQLREYDVALMDVNQAVRLNPQHYSAIYLRALIHKKLKRFDLAFSDAQLAKSLGYPVDERFLELLQNEANK